MRLMEGLKNMIQSWLEITPAQKSTIVIEEDMDFQTNVSKNRIWQRGIPYELNQLYKDPSMRSDAAMFWGVVPRIPIRKIHTGLPGLIVQVLSAIAVRDLNGIELSERQDDWEKISQKTDIKDFCETAVSDALVTGDGAFKISFDRSLSEYPIIEFYPADAVDFDYQRGMLKEVVFKSVKKGNDRDKTKYLFKEHYGWGYIRYELFEIRGSAMEKTDLSVLEETSRLSDVGFGGYSENKETGETITPGNYMMAVPFKIFKSPRWKGRGASIFDRKVTSFDGLDEIVSQWADAVRTGRAKTYIPDVLTPKDQSGRNIMPNPFDDHFVTTGSDLTETGKNTIEVKQPIIPSENYLESYVSFLDLCLQGIISPSTLGIDTKKLDNAEAQREKEKTTMYTRNAIIGALEKTLPDLVRYSIMAMDSMQNREDPAVLDINVNINFGEYANPSFEAVVETVSKARSGNVMSVEAAVDELYGDSKDDEWKAQEVQRIKEEQGVAQMSEPAVNTESGGFNINWEA